MCTHANHPWKVRSWVLVGRGRGRESMGREEATGGYRREHHMIAKTILS